MSSPSPTLREHLTALLVAMLCGVAFLGEGLLPGNAVVPFPLERLEPWRSEVDPAALRDLHVGNASLGDKYGQSLAWDRITADAFSEGRLPLWTRDIAGGQPFVPQMGQVYEPFTQLLRVVPAPAIYGWWFLLHQVLFGWFCYLFVRRIGTSHAAALLAVVCAVVGLWMQARIHHNVIVTAALPTFPMLLCVQALFRGGGAGTAALLAISVAVAWLGGLPQVALQATWLMLGYAVLETARTPGRRLRPLLFLGAGLAAGALVAFAQMGPVLEARAVTSRLEGTPELLAERALEFDHLLAAFWPDLLHWPADRFYVPPNGVEFTRSSWFALWRLDDARLRAGFTNWPETAFGIGIAGWLLAFAGIRSRLRGDARFFTGVAVLGLLLATATPPLLQLSAIVPGARAGDWKRMLFLVAIAAPVLAALGAQRLLDGERLRGTWLAAAALTVVSAAGAAFHMRSPAAIEAFYAQRCLAALAERTGSPPLPVEAFHGAVTREPIGDEAATNRDRLLQTFVATTVFAGVACALLALRRRRLALALLIAANALDLVVAGRGPVVVVPSERVTTPPQVLDPALRADAAARDAAAPRPRIQRLQRDTTAPPLLLPNLGAFLGLEDLAGYVPLPPRRYEEFFAAIEPTTSLGGVGVGAFRDPASLTHPLLDVVGLRFVLSDAALEGGGVTALGADRHPRLYERTTTLPRATFVAEAHVVVEPDRAARLTRLVDRSRDARTTAIVETADFAPDATATRGGTATVVRHANDEVVVDVDAQSAGVLRLADPFDAGWTATLGAERIPVFPVDHWLRGVRLPAGSHRVTFRFDGPSVVRPQVVAAVGLLGIVALSVAAAVSARRRRHTGNAS